MKRFHPWIRLPGTGSVLLPLALVVFAADRRTPSGSEANAAEPVMAETNTSPVAVFRSILKMSPAERGEFLTNNYPPDVRERILSKIEEYQLLPGPYAELRLRTTELGWYLRPLLTMSSTNRAERLQQIPQPYQKLIADRLQEWDLWPPSLKEEILEYESTMDHFVGHGAVVAPQIGVQSLPPGERTELERKLERWEALPSAQRQQMYASFERYFRLSEDERQKMLDALTEPERDQTEKALDPIEQWPKAEQKKYLTAFKQFLAMSPAQRHRFQQSSERWQKMSESERQAWRDLVKQLSSMPPLPPGYVPPSRSPAGGAPVSLRTNPLASPQQ